MSSAGTFVRIFRLFHLSASMTETVGWHYHAFHKLCVYLGGDAIPLRH